MIQYRRCLKGTTFLLRPQPHRLDQSQFKAETMMEFLEINLFYLLYRIYFISICHRFFNLFRLIQKPFHFKQLHIRNVDLFFF